MTDQTHPLDELIASAWTGAQETLQADGNDGYRITEAERTLAYATIQLADKLREAREAWAEATGVAFCELRESRSIYQVPSESWHRLARVLGRWASVSRSVDAIDVPNGPGDGGRER